MILEQAKAITRVRYFIYSVASILLIIHFLFLMEACSSASNASLREIGQIQLSPLGFNRSSVNLPIFRHNAMLTIGNIQITSYFGIDGSIILAFRDLRTNVMNYRTLVNAMDPSALGDGHKAINMVYTEDGFLHLVYGAHGTLPFYYKLSMSSPVSSNFQVVSTDAGELALAGEHITYPAFYSATGQTILFYRNDDDGTLCLNEYDLTSHQWHVLKAPWLYSPAITTQTSIYINTLGVFNNYIAAAFTIRVQNTPLVDNQNLYLVYSDDHGQTWKDSKGSALTSPILVDALSPLIVIPQDHNLINQSGAYLDPKLHFHMAYYADDSIGIPQIFAADFNLNTLKLEQLQKVTNRTEDFQLIGFGTLSLPISRPMPFEIAGTLHILYREQNNILMLTRDTKLGWNQEVLYSGPIKNWEPVLDYRLLNNGRLSLFVQGAEQGIDDRLAFAAPEYPTKIIDYQ